MNLNLFLAAVWFVIAIGIFFFLPNTEENAVVTISPERRMMLGGFTLLLTGWNMVRWRLSRIRRQAEEADARAMEMSRRSYRHYDEPPNPDFDFSDPRPGGPPPPPASS